MKKEFTFSFVMVFGLHDASICEKVGCTLMSNGDCKNFGLDKDDTYYVFTIDGGFIMNDKEIIVKKRKIPISNLSNTAYLTNELKF